MKKFYRTKYIAAFALIISLLISLCAFSAPAVMAAQDPDIQAEAAVLVETKTGKVLYGHNENERRAPASLTKVMTAALVIEAYERGDININDEVTVSSKAYYDITSDASSLGLKTGEELTVKELLYCALIVSANEACNVLAEYVSGDVETFLELMNSRAKELGCKDTHFANTHGLPNEDHYSTAYDMYIITANAMKLSLFAKIVDTANYTLPATNMYEEERELVTTNRIINPQSEYYYDLAHGVKTGYTDAAGYCLISSAENEELSLISVVMGAKSSVLEDGRTQIDSFPESVRLLKWGFDSFSYRTILSTLDILAEAPIRFGDGVDSVILRPKENITVLLDNDVDIDERILDVHILEDENSEELTAPISQGEVMGSVSITLDGVDYGTVPLVSNTSVSLNKAEYMRSRVKATLSNTYVILAIILLAIFFFSYIAYIILYNKNRKRKIRAADEAARQRIEELRRKEGSTIGKSFEEIERMHSQK